MPDIFPFRVSAEMLPVKTPVVPDTLPFSVSVLILPVNVPVVPDIFPFSVPVLTLLKTVNVPVFLLNVRPELAPINPPSLNKICVSLPAALKLPVIFPTTFPMKYEAEIFPETVKVEPILADELICKVLPVIELLTDIELPCKVDPLLPIIEAFIVVPVNVLLSVNPFSVPTLVMLG